MRLAIFGSRSLIGDETRAAIKSAVADLKATHLVTAGEPQGVCDEARHVAKELSLPLTLHWLKQKERAAGKYHWRTIDVLSDCECILFIYDGVSKGTANEMKVAKKMNVKRVVITIRPSISNSALLSACKTAMSEN